MLLPSSIASLISASKKLAFARFMEVQTHVVIEFAIHIHLFEGGSFHEEKIVSDDNTYDARSECSGYECLS